MQEKCCGVYGYKDWQKTPFTHGNHSIVPDSCCKEVKQGCGDISAGTENINIGVTAFYFLLLIFSSWPLEVAKIEETS